MIFIFGVLAMSLAISKTGLDRRIGLLLLGPAKSRARFLFIFLPLLGVACSFVSEHALIAFIMPLFMMVYLSTVRAAGIKQDKALAVMFVLSMCFVANCGGPGSPAAGGRNAVMMGILADYGMAPTFGQWVMYGLPFVPVMALVIGAYFFLVFRNKIKVKKLNVSALVRQASDKIGPMNRSEYITAVVLVGLILLWILAADKYGMGGPVLLVLVFLNIARVIRWRDITSIPWDVVALYASACALGKGLAVTGAALYLADGFRGRAARVHALGRGTGHRGEPLHRPDDQLHERRRHRFGDRADHRADGHDLRHPSLDGRIRHRLRLVVRPHADHRNAQQRHRLRAGQGPDHRRAAGDPGRLLQARRRGAAVVVCRALGMDLPGLLAVYRILTEKIGGVRIWPKTRSNC